MCLFGICMTSVKCLSSVFLTNPQLTFYLLYIYFAFFFLQFPDVQAQITDFRIFLLLHVCTNVMNFSLNTVSSLSHTFLYVPIIHLFIHSSRFIFSLDVMSLTHALFTSVFFTFQVFGNFCYFSGIDFYFDSILFRKHTL